MEEGGKLPPPGGLFSKDGVSKMPAQKGNRTKKKLSNRSANKKAALKRRRDRARRK
jgi:hypothetical protein